MVDTTPDFRYQMLRAKVEKLDAVLFTHPHKDHIAGLDDVKAFNFFSGKANGSICQFLTEEALKREFSYVFSDKKYPGIPEINLNTIDDESFLYRRYSCDPDSCLAPENACIWFSVWQVHLHHRCQPDRTKRKRRKSKAAKFL